MATAIRRAWRKGQSRLCAILVRCSASITSAAFPEEAEARLRINASILVSVRKGQRRGCPFPVRELMALNRLTARSPAAGRQAIFLGATGPRAARPEKGPAAERR